MLVLKARRYDLNILNEMLSHGIIDYPNPVILTRVNTRDNIFRYTRFEKMFHAFYLVACSKVSTKIVNIKQIRKIDILRINDN